MTYARSTRFAMALGAAIAISTSAVLRAEDAEETPIQGTIRLSNTQDREVVLVESAKISIEQAVKAAVSRDNGAVQRVELADLSLFWDSGVPGLDEVGETFRASLGSDTEQNERRKSEKTIVPVSPRVRVKAPAKAIA